MIRTEGRGVDDRTNFKASPTDLLMTPCTAKLQAHKQKRFAKYVPLVIRGQGLIYRTKGKVLQFGANTSSRLAASPEDRENEQPQR